MKKNFLLMILVTWIIMMTGCSAASDTAARETAVPTETSAVTEAASTSATAAATTPPTQSAPTVAPTAAETIAPTEAVIREAQPEGVLRIDVNGNTLYADFEDNSSAQALKEILTTQTVTMEMSDYGGFEKVGDLPFSLPTNDENITTAAGDVILYQGNKLTIYYDTNTWSFTKVAKIRNADSSLRNLLGDGTVSVTISME